MVELNIPNIDYICGSKHWFVYSSIILLQIIELINVFHWNYELLIWFKVQPVDYLSPIIKLITMLYLIYVQILYRQHCIYSSGPLFIFSLMFAIYHLINFRTILLAIFTNSGIYYAEINHIQLICRTMATMLSFMLLLFNCFSHPTPKTNTIKRMTKHRTTKHQHEHHFDDNEMKAKNYSQLGLEQINPWYTSGFLSRITFWWFNPFIWLGYCRPLVERDIFRLEPENRSVNIIHNFECYLNNYLRKQCHIQMKINSNKHKHNYDSNEYLLPSTSHKKHEYQHFEQDQLDNVKRINLGVVLIRAYWKLILFTVTMKFIASMMTFINPMVLDYLISFMSTPDEPKWHGFFYASLMLISPAIESIVSNQYEYWVSVTVLRARVSITSMIYHKSLKMSNHCRNEYSTGEITNIMSVDTQRVTDFLVSANTLWSAPFQIGLAFYMLWQQVQVASMAGLGFMIILIPINGLAMRKIRSFQIDVMKQKDQRTKLMNEVLNGMKVLKLYAWENSFLKMIQQLRSNECNKLYSVMLFSGFIMFAFSAAPFLVGLFTFTTYVLMGNVLDPNKAFVSLSLFSIIRAPLGMLPMLLTTGVQAIVSLNRINKFLNSEDQDGSVKHLPDEECAVKISQATFTWQRHSPATLNNISLNVPRGKLVAIVGTVGSGKSSLLSSILGDMNKLTGSINVDGKLAYVPQQAWIQNQTVRKNITFSMPYNEKKYQKVIKYCCLEPDLRILQAGDQTEIGERGINLSGGQKQRISLARAVYSEADIFLLDDPLSAVDANVGDKLFKNVIGNEGLLRTKTRILATHRAMILPEVDEIIVMKDGEISERGTMNELMNSQGAFAEFITEYMDENFNLEFQKSVNDSGTGVDSELARSFAEKVRPILERSKSRTEHIDSMQKSKTKQPKRQISQSSSGGHWSSQSSYSQNSLQKRKRSLSISMQFEGGEFLHRDEEKESGRLIQEEIAQTGSVKFAIYGQYFHKIGLSVTIFILISMIISNGFQMATNLWLGDWSNDALDAKRATDVSLRNHRLIIYGSLGAGEILFSISGSLILSLSCVRAAKHLHNDMLQRIMFAPMTFFDTTPIGRILNRFTKDVDVADSSLSFSLRMALMQFFRTIVSFAMISLEASIILIAIIPILFFYYIIQRIYIASSRQLKRIESITRSPIYHHFRETVTGISSIKAYGVQSEFIAECHRRLDTNSSCFYSSFAATRWLSIRLEFFGYLIVFLAALFAVISRNTLSPGLAGLAISYSLNITAVMAMFVRSLTDLETNIVSVERLIEYTELQQELNYFDTFNQPKKRWPQKGSIRFDSYSTRYRPGLDLVLKNVQFTVKPREKIGVVGRTGAGKSSLTLALFRIIEPSSGTIHIDNVDITKIGLYDLRSRITIIPQDPVLFTGSLRMNLDPFDYYLDEHIWQALELANLKEFVQTLHGGLQHSITEGGDNISLGQRQLLCLARALLRKSKILVLDEATAAVDMETDELIQKTIRREFDDCTIFTIAHRINTVIDYDRILVLDAGRIAEYDSPANLKKQTDSIFYSMAKIAKLI